MTSYVPLLPTFSPRRGPCQDRWTTGATSEAVGTLDQRSRRSDCPIWDAPGAELSSAPAAQLCERRDARARHEYENVILDPDGNRVELTV